MCKEQVWYTAMDDTTPYSGDVELSDTKRGTKVYGLGHCWKCHNGSGIYWRKTWNGAFPDTCWSCNGTGKGRVRLYTLKQVQAQIKKADNALRNIAYNNSEKGLAYRNKRLSWKRDKIADKHKSNFVGTLKQREDFTLTLTFRKGFDGDFGTSWLNSLKDAQGNVFTYWGASLLDVEVNDTVTVKATVKEHKEYQGVNQTVIQRPKIIKEGK